MTDDKKGSFIGLRCEHDVKGKVEVISRFENMTASQWIVLELKKSIAAWEAKNLS